METVINFKRHNIRKVVVLLFFTITYFQTSGQEETKQLGNVVYSVLSPDLFREQNGNGWFLLDGGIDLKANGFTFNQTDLCLSTGAFCNELPDARGVFIRGMNMNRSTKSGDVDNARKVGSLQLDSVGHHSHKFEAGIAIAKDKDNPGDPGGHIQGPENNKWSFETTNIGNGIINETRPKNINLYIYIKLNN